MRHKNIFLKAGLLFSLLFLFETDISYCQSKDYFQQGVKYTIHVSLDDKKHILSGTETIVYANNSPETLKEIYIHLWPNAYRNNQTALAGQIEKFGSGNFIRSRVNERGYIDSLNFSVDQISSSYRLLTDTSDICLLALPAPLPPGKSVEITTSFRVKIPDAGISRLGHSGQAYYITQWYPKPAVYDRNGWNYMPYLDKGEFYSEFGEYDVHINLPANYVVASTGEILDQSELEWLLKKANNTAVQSDHDLSFPPSSIQRKTIHIHAKQVHDFAWFADKRFHVEKGTAVLPSGRTINTAVFYTNNQLKYWKRALAVLNQTVVKFSDWFGEYPYSSAAAVDGLSAEGSDMEYPMITLMGRKKSFEEFENTLAHEVSHFWYYGILGSNERKAGWMDEGLATFAKAKYAHSENDHPNYVKRYGSIEEFYNLHKLSMHQAQNFVYRSGASLNIDQPSDLDANLYPRLNYVADVYYKPALAFNHLYAFLGDSIFRKCLHSYFETWKFKHPDAKAMQHSFEAASGKDLSWFFNDIIHTTKKVDYKVENVIREDAGLYSLYLKNKGGVNIPFNIKGFQNDSLIVSEWFGGFDNKTSVHLHCKECDVFRIDADETLPEVNRQNNLIKTEGFLRTMEAIRFKFLGDVEPADKATVFYTPILGYNDYDKLMLGGAVYNLSLIEKSFEFALMPLYSSNSKNLSGGGRIMYNRSIKNELINHISMGVGVSHYSFDDGYATDYTGYDPLSFTKLSVDLIIDFKQKDQSCNSREYLTLRNIFTSTERIAYPICNTCDSESEIYTTDNRYFIFADYVKERPRVFHPSSIQLTAGLNRTFYKLSFEYNKTYSYSRRGKGFDFRFYSGLSAKAFHGEDDVYIDHRIHMSGIDGTEDYMYDGTFFERSNTESPQFISTEGGFKAPTNIGQSRWLMAVNLKTVIHPVLPIKFYMNLGTYDDAATAFEGSKVVMYELGLEVFIVPGAMAVYFPLSYSKDIKSEFDTNDLKFGDLIRFEFNLNKLSPFVLLKQKMRYGNF